MFRNTLFLLMLVMTIFLGTFLIGCSCSDDDDPSTSSGQADDDDDDTADDDDDDDDDYDDDDDDDDYTERLMVGVASGYLDAPIGISMGGFGARIGPKTPYNQLMGGSEGYRDRPNVKVVALHMRDRRIIIVKAAIAWPSGSMRTQIVNIVKDRTGRNIDRSLILNGTHTHSGPARFFVSPDIVGLIGMDTYDQDLTDRISNSFAEIIIQAMENMEPGKIGFGYRENFDPGYIYANDRRCENGPVDFMENRLWTGLVERDNGEDLAVLVGAAMHGVLYNKTFMTGDAPDGIERGIEAGYDYPVVAMYIQGSAGDASPKTSSPLGHNKDQNVQWRGWSIAKMIREIHEGITTESTPDLNIITKRYRHDRETLGYQPGEFGFHNFRGEFQEYEVGALLCAVLANPNHDSIVDCDDPSTSLQDGYLGCVVDLGWSIFGDQIEYFRQSPITVAQIGDHYFYTVPGELTAHLAVDIRTEIANTLGVDFEKINSIGYGQNYIFYLTQDWDWMQGGFEVEGSLFGWRMGRWLTEEIPQMASLLPLGDPGPYDDPEPMLYYEEPDPVEPEISENLGVVQVQPLAVNSRFDTVHFEWHGGHPGVDMFTVTLQKEQGSQFIDVTKPNGTPYDEKGWEMFVMLEPTPAYRGTIGRDSRDFLYILDWETNWNDPSGTLRFKVEGTAKTASGIGPYVIFSEPFELDPVESVELSNLTAVVNGTNLDIQVDGAYPPNISGWRLRSPFSGGSNLAIVSAGVVNAIISVTGFPDEICELTFNEDTLKLEGSIPITHTGMEHTISIEAQAFDDGFENTNGVDAGPFVISVPLD